MWCGGNINKRDIYIIRNKKEVEQFWMSQNPGVWILSLLYVLWLLNLNYSIILPIIYLLLFIIITRPTPLPFPFILPNFLLFIYYLSHITGHYFSILNSLEDFLALDIKRAGRREDDFYVFFLSGQALHIFVRST